LTTYLEQAGCWFLHSGIQEPSGGVARFYRSDAQANAAVSTEITGYAASAWAYLYERTGQRAHLDAAIRAARYLTREAWDAANHTFPFEPGSAHAYFFDIGIIVRGLVAVWRATGDEEFRERAEEGAISLALDFLGEGDFHPVIELPEKQPAPRDRRWSRSPGCYQLKSALAWRDAGGEHGARMFDCMLAYALATHETFLTDEREKLMDRLHAYCYFLEALLAVCEREEARRALAGGIATAGRLLREIAPEFERSDVSAQLLRVRLMAHHLGAVELDAASAEDEAARAASFLSCDADGRLRGGFWFGRKGGAMLPFMNPVSTAFSMQALDLWGRHQRGEWRFELHELI
jgi:hypothetical protein